MPGIRNRKRLQALHALACLGTALAGHAQAQQTTPPKKAPTELEAVIITAERRLEDSKAVPVSASLIKSEQVDVLMASGQDVRALAAKIPSLNIESSNGRTLPRFYLRGYGNTDFSMYASQPVSLVYDDVVQESAALKGFPMFDLENVEVLRGPQGTLFGRNTPAGVLKFSSVKPAIGATDGYVNLSAGSYGTLNLDAAASLPLGRQWALRAAVLNQRKNDWVRIESTQPGNLYNGQRTEGYSDRAARVQLLHQPDARFSALLNLHGRDLDGSSRVFRANILKAGSNELVDGFDRTRISTNGKNEQQFRSHGASANLSWQADTVSLHSITGYERITRYRTRGDIDGGDTLTAATRPFQVEVGGGINRHRQLTQEFRIASRLPGPLHYQAGLYGFHEILGAEEIIYDSASGQPTQHLHDEQANTAWAAFGSLAYDLSPALKLRSGLRYTWDEKTFRLRAGYATPQDKTIASRRLTGDLSGTYQLQRDASLYARLSTGFRGASFARPRFDQALDTHVQPETTIAYEAGLKTDLLDRRARLAFSVFRYDVSKQQVTAIGGANNDVTLVNAGRSRGQGFELEAEALVTPTLRFSAGLSFNDTGIRDPALRVPVCGSGLCHPVDPVQSGLASIHGNPLPNAPRWVANTTAHYRLPLDNGHEAYVFADLAYRSAVNFVLYEAREFTGKPVTELGLKAGYLWGGGKYDAALFCRNCTDQVRVIGAIDFHNLTGMLNEPRTIGLQLRINFD